MTVSKNVTLGATMTAALIMVFFFRAPILPVAFGAFGAAFLILRRKPEA